ncbi:unnamed protein product [Bemisia tabaci]|uniref:Sulfotransferase domain-containing protein n=1 Tax=Bemisia tabaci TaxID=7038 RepID=A0A9P0F976_BEMTA|nr:unnamed protein product [Bemisia tabaci]
MVKQRTIEKIGNDTECGKILNTFFVGALRDGYVKVEGVVMPSGYTAIAQQVCDLEIRDDDIFVCSYPKSGTTWTQEMVWCIANDLDYKRAQIAQDKRFPFLECTGHANYGKARNECPEIEMEDFVTDSLKFIRELESPRFIKSHLPFCLLPKQLTNFSTEAKIVYVCRNPKDACISQYHHSQLFLGYSGNFEMFCELFLNDMLPYSPYWDHIRTFWEHRNNPKVLFLTYEDLKKDLGSAIKKTAKFLGKSLSNEQVSSLVEYLSFDNMKRNKAVNKEQVKMLNQKCGGFKIDGSFIRSGVVGGGKPR